MTRQQKLTKLRNLRRMAQESPYPDERASAQAMYERLSLKWGLSITEDEMNLPPELWFDIKRLTVVHRITGCVVSMLHPVLMRRSPGAGKSWRIFIRGTQLQSALAFERYKELHRIYEESLKWRRTEQLSFGCQTSFLCGVTDAFLRIMEKERVRNSPQTDCQALVVYEGSRRPEPEQKPNRAESAATSNQVPQEEEQPTSVESDPDEDSESSEQKARSQQKAKADPGPEIIEATDRRSYDIGYGVGLKVDFGNKANPLHKLYRKAQPIQQRETPSLLSLFSRI